MVKRAKPLPDREWITVKELADSTGYTRQAIYGLIERGAISPVEFKRKKASLYRFTKDDAERIVANIRSGLPMTLAGQAS